MEILKLFPETHLEQRKSQYVFSLHLGVIHKLNVYLFIIISYC